MALASPAPRVLADYAARTALAQIVLVFCGAAFVGIAAQIAIPLPFTPVPLTLQTFAVLLAGAALGSLRGVASMGLYALMGVVGVPWFAEGSSGFSSASFGYILGFILAAFIVGRLAEGGGSTTPTRSAALMVIGNLAIYAVGVTWLKFAIDSSWATALSLGVVPFLIGDAIKIALAAGLLPLSWKGLEKLNLRNN
ncbi:MAG: biotin transporter BioY [Candidatus Nanopelagicales bacterium]|jgi:biotin transport system substrate-specific component|nr:biotin transporter BioY [Actinomycetota bacterium]NCG02253.1 biotin transporter BioY [Actinomycetales bacterium]MBT5183077.1 biotin transporter BioY [Actinomycetota bacterium]MBT5500710.1 biotin transporter BioY [Actinomycetota bacterium]MBT5807424.1 biotin transporter BioY [Actinomycetota bacterium]